MRIFIIISILLFVLTLASRYSTVISYQRERLPVYDNIIISDDIMRDGDEGSACGYVDNVLKGCFRGLFCHFYNQTCGVIGNSSKISEVGVCERIPLGCPMCNVTSSSTTNNDTCGCDGKWYCSSCHVYMAGWSESTKDRCGINSALSVTQFILPESFHLLGFILLLFCISLF